MLLATFSHKPFHWILKGIAQCPEGYSMSEGDSIKQNNNPLWEKTTKATLCPVSIM